MQISFVTLSFLLFSDQILGGGKVSERDKLLDGDPPAPPSPPVEESQELGKVSICI